MSDTANIQNSALNKEQKRLIYDSLTTNIIRFQEYRLDKIKPDGAVLFEYLSYNSYKLFAEDQSSGGYFYHSYERIKKEFGIGKARVQKLVDLLRSWGVVETKVCGFPQNTHYRVRFDILAETVVLNKLFRVAPARLKELGAHYLKVAKSINLAADTAQDLLYTEFPYESDWHKYLSKLYYKERERFNRLIPTQSAIKKQQPRPRAATLRNIREGLRLIEFGTEEIRHNGAELDRRQLDLVNGFRLYCGLLFLFLSEVDPEQGELKAWAEESYCADYLINYASGIRDPIAYFFSRPEGMTNDLFPSFIDEAASVKEFNKGYFSN